MRRRSRILWPAACAAALACRSAAPGGGAADEAAIPAAAFFRDPQVAHVTVSPDGERMAGILQPEGVPVLFEKAVRGADARSLGKIGERGATVRTVGWAGDATIVVGYDTPRDADRGQTRTLRMLPVSIDRWRSPELGQGWRLPTHPDRSDGVLHWLPEEPERILVNHWESDREGASARSVRVRDGIQRTVVPARAGVRRWFADMHGAVRAAHGWDAETATEVVYARRDAEGPFELLGGGDLVQESYLAFAGFAVDPKTLYVYSTTESDRTGLYAYDLAQRGPLRLVHADPEVDVGALVHAPDDGRLWAVEVERERPQLHFMDAAGQREQAAIDATFPGTTNRIVSASRDGVTAILRVSGDTHPPDYYLYDRPRREMAALPSAYPALEGKALSPMQPVRFTARDGVQVPGYLTLPPGAEPQGLPVIVVVHDGPTERVHWDFDAAVQFLASRGFAVFQPNFRGSSGYGREYERLGYREWGGAMQHDLADGVRWLVAEGIADADRVGIYGRGYGGYAALMGLATTPELFRAAAAFGAVTDLVDLIENPHRYDTTDPNPPLAGASARDVERLAGVSPARLAERMRSPVLLAHGGRDPVVDVSQLRAMQGALESAGREVESLVYRDEGHELVVEENRIDFHQKLASFFERNLRVRVPL